MKQQVRDMKTIIDGYKTYIILGVALLVLILKNYHIIGDDQAPLDLGQFWAYLFAILSGATIRNAIPPKQPKG